MSQVYAKEYVTRLVWLEDTFPYEKAEAVRKLQGVNPMDVQLDAPSKPIRFLFDHYPVYPSWWTHKREATAKVMLRQARQEDTSFNRARYRLHLWLIRHGVL